MLVKTNTVVVDAATKARYECSVCHRLVEPEAFDPGSHRCLACVSDEPKRSSEKEQTS